MSDKTEIKEEINIFLKRNFPQIQMHGGSSSITHIDEEERYVEIQLGGSCSGCGISPMTTQAIKRKLPKDVDGIDSVSVVTGMEETSLEGPDLSDKNYEEKNDNIPDAPF